MKKLLPIVLVVIGVGAGLGTGLFLRPAPPDPVQEKMACSDQENTSCEEPTKPVLSFQEEPGPDPDGASDFVKLSKQFVVPIVKKDRVRALVVMSITLEVDTGSTDAVFGREPKLRDGFLQVMFEHANTGGFDGAFTTGESMRDLRGALKQVAVRSAGEIVQDILITEMVKQAL